MSSLFANYCVQAQPARDTGMWCRHVCTDVHAVLMKSVNLMSEAAKAGAGQPSTSMVQEHIHSLAFLWL